MTEFTEKQNYTYLIGFEESYGYLVGNHARDKDGVVASMLIAEMAAYYAQKGKSLYEALQDIYKKYGFYAEKTVSFTMPGKDGMEKMANILAGLRTNPPKSANGMDIVKYTDYKEQTIMLVDGSELPKSNVLRYDLSDGKTYFIVRPSGTEPKIKIYLGSNAETFDAAMETVDAVLADVKEQLGL